MSQSSTLPALDARRQLALIAAGYAGITVGGAPAYVITHRVHLSSLNWLALVAVTCAGIAVGLFSLPSGKGTVWEVLLAGWLAGVAVLATRSATYPLTLILGAALCWTVVPLVLPAPPPGSPPARQVWEGFRSPLEFRWYGGWLLGVALALLVLFFKAPTTVQAASAALAAAAAVRGGVTRNRPVGRPLVRTLCAGAALALLGLVGATNPAASWLGPVTSHGPRAGGRVALTFDDGPNGEATLAVLRELDAAGVKGAFFLVGKAVDREPDVAQRIIADGHLVGNHSYSHDGWRYIEPAYPELEHGERAIAATTGACPRFYRPPHGTHTPFVWLAAEREEMRLVTWDVSAEDWIANDPKRLADDIVAKARDGSIILLHDGLDGKPGIDRQVLIDALPRIIDGLRAKGLQPVRLDELLGDSGTLPTCPL